jgi:hypothetical protein
MTALTAAFLQGLPGTDSDQGGKEIWNKATSGSSAIAAGKIAFLVESTGIARIGGAGDSGRQGIVCKDSPNLDGDAQFAVYTKPGTEAYGIAGGTIEPGARVTTGAAGVAVQYAATDQTGSYVEATIELGEADFGRAPWVYVGHNGEGSSFDQKATQATVGQAVRLRHL